MPISLKVAMKVAYKGENFFGFQSQKDKNTIAKALKNALNSTGIFCDFEASGRTDKGVHASAQVISLEIPHFHKDLQNLKQRLNAKLYPEIKIKAIWQVKASFHARFSAKKRSYCYVISQSQNPFLSSFSHFYSIKNPQLLKDSLKNFIGRHDFKAFMKKGGSGDKSGSVREIYQAKLLKKGNFYIFYFQANGFLRAQIRLMIGFLLEIDKGNLSLKDLQNQLNGKEIFRIPAPSCGLFLSGVQYIK